MIKLNCDKLKLKIFKSNFFKFNVLQLLVPAQNGSLHQKDAVHDNDFEPYLSGQSNQVSSLFKVYFCISLVEFSNTPLLPYL